LVGALMIFSGQQKFQRGHPEIHFPVRTYLQAATLQAEAASLPSGLEKFK